MINKHMFAGLVKWFSRSVVLLPLVAVVLWLIFESIQGNIIWYKAGGMFVGNPPFSVAASIGLFADVALIAVIFAFLVWRGVKIWKWLWKKAAW
jgi:hypothetical protein